MLLSDCFQLGVVTKAHGIKGAVQIHIESDNPGHYIGLESVLLLINNEPVPFFLRNWQVTGDKAIAELDEVNSIEAAEQLVNKEVYLPDRFLPKLTDSQYFFHSLIGLTAIEKGTPLGSITNVYSLPGHNLLALDHKGNEVLIPLSDEIVKKVSLDTGMVEVELPDGLLDIYLNS